MGYLFIINGMSINLKKIRLLIPISFSFSIRYLYRTGMLAQLRQFVEPVIMITWPQHDLVEELRHDGFEVHIIQESQKGIAYQNIRARIDFWFKWFALKSPSKEVQVKYLDQYYPYKKVFIRKLREVYNQLKYALPANRKKLFIAEADLLVSDTNYIDMLALVDSLQVDAVFTCAPFQTQEDMLLRACKAKGKYMLASILSFDNITKRGWIPVTYDAYMVWNAYNATEVKRIYPNAARNNNVHVVGAAQFDFYFKPAFVMPEEVWRKSTGITAAGRKIILYAGGPKVLFPNEPQYIKHLDEAIEAGEITGKPIILFRCHPIDDVERWKRYIGPSSNIIFDTSWTGKEKYQYVNVTKDDIQKLCSTLAYTDVHINLISTMSVDGSAYNKPQIAPAYDEVRPHTVALLRNMYYQEHYLPIMRTNGLLFAQSKQEFIALTNKALQNKTDHSMQAQSILKEIITYTDGKSTERVVDVIRQSLEEHFASE